MEKELSEIILSEGLPFSNSITGSEPSKENISQSRFSIMILFVAKLSIDPAENLIPISLSIILFPSINPWEDSKKPIPTLHSVTVLFFTIA